MDFMNRGERPVQQNTQTQTPGAANTAKTPGNSSKVPKFDDKRKAIRAAYVLFAGIIGIIVILVLVMTIFSKDVGSREANKVDGSKFQAVFLNGGQVYFGKIDDLNSKYLSMNNIYYLRVNQQVQPDQQQNSANNDISLVKLGCELHGPEDKMVINREQVIFWENLKDDGQVAKAVAEYVKANPNGQKCDQQQGASSTTNSNAPATNGTTGTGASNTGTTNNTGTGTGTGTTGSTSGR